MEAVCPNAWLLGYAILYRQFAGQSTIIPKLRTWVYATACRTPRPSWQNTSASPLKKFPYWVAGINHFAWFLEFKWNGKDAYPLYAKHFENPAVFRPTTRTGAGADIVRAESLENIRLLPDRSQLH